LVEIVSWDRFIGLVRGDGRERTNGDAQAVGTDEVLAAVAAGELLAVTADGVGGHGLAGDLGVALRGALGGGDGNSGHGGDDKSLEEGHFGGLGWFGKKG
jgi:hypothetical protein